MKKKIEKKTFVEKLFDIKILRKIKDIAYRFPFSSKNSITVKTKLFSEHLPNW